MEYEQGTPEWLEWRRTRIGASDAAIVLGISPWKTPHKLWLEKSGRQPAPPMNSAMAYGHQMEDEVRQTYEQENGELYMPTTVTNPKYEWQVASLDGLSADRKTVLEIKTCSKKVYEAACRGEVPEYYMTQLQHQLLCVPEAERAIIVFWHKGDWTAVDVPPNGPLQKRITDVEKAFYEQCMVGDQAPALSEKDYLFIEGNDEFKSAANSWKTINEQLQKYKKLDAEARQKLLELTDDGNCKGYGVSICHIYRKGSIDYSRVPQIKGVDLEPYRKGSVAYTQVKPYKEQDQ